MIKLERRLYKNRTKHRLKIDKVSIELEWSFGEIQIKLQ